MKDTRYRHSVDVNQLRSLPIEQQREVMESWFRARYEDPAERTPYESAEGGYLWIWGGPYDAREELRDEFEGIILDEVIENLADHLDDESAEWAPVASADDYDHNLLNVVRSNSNALTTLNESLDTVRHLARHDDKTLADIVNRLLYANVITALETYLSDSFINRVLNDSQLLRRFIEVTPYFRNHPLHYSDVFRAVDEAGDKAQGYLLDIVWHNLTKVQAMYRDTLAVDFRSKLPDVAKALPKRHAIVHRNGKGKDGVVVEVSSDELIELVSAVEAFVLDIDRQLSMELPPISSSFESDTAEL